jgi:hypothetical protein
MANIGGPINPEKPEEEDCIEQEQRMQQLFRRKAEEGDGMAMIAYSLCLIADQLASAACELSRLADAKEIELDRAKIQQRQC